MKLPTYAGCLLCLGASLAAADGHYAGAADCEAYARNEARNQGRVMGGAARGATRGAIIGGLVGDNSESARRGAKLGAVAGGLRRARQREQAYSIAYERCMADVQYQREEASRREAERDSASDQQ